MMREVRVIATMTALAIAGCQAGNPLDTSTGEDKRQALNAECDKALQALYSEVHQARTIVADARGTLVFPNLTKAGFIVGAETGNGCLYEDGEITSYFNKSGGSFGWQAGAQSSSQVLVLTSDAAMKKLQSAAGLDFGGNASATVIDTGAGATVNTAELMNNEIIAFVLGERGLMAGATLEGTKVTEFDWKT
jgi:lipid-binding SYLF domain-containing protein